MTTINLQLPDELRLRAERRAAEAGHATIEEYIESLVRADADDQDCGGPEHLAIRSDEHLEALLLNRLDEAGAVQATPEFWATLKQRAAQRRQQKRS